MIAYMEGNRKSSPVVTELFLREQKLNISLVSTSKSYFKVSNSIRLSVKHFLVMKIPNKREFHQIVSNHSSDIGCKDFMKLYKKYTKDSF